MARKIIYVEPEDYFPKEIRDKYFKKPDNKPENEKQTTKKPVDKENTK